MRKNRILPALVVGALVHVATIVPAAIAAGNDDQSESKMENRSEQAQGAIKDAWLDGKLESALLFNQHLNSFNIDTDVQNGVAYLRGAVESDIDRDLAGQIAESIEGVTDVKNELEVDKTKARAEHDNAAANQANRGFKQAVTNATTTARIKSELLVNSNTAGLAINVDSMGGEVTLSGAVSSEQERALAGQIAANTDGVDSVDNQLTVKKGS